MSKTAKWIIGILAILVVLQFAVPFLWQWLFPAANAYGFGMPMMRGYGMHMPMWGFSFLGVLFMWLIPLGTLILIGLAIAYLWKKLTEKSTQ